MGFFFDFTSAHIAISGSKWRYRAIRKRTYFNAGGVDTIINTVLLSLKYLSLMVCFSCYANSMWFYAYFHVFPKRNQRELVPTRCSSRAPRTGPSSCGSTPTPSRWCPLIWTTRLGMSHGRPTLPPCLPLSPGWYIYPKKKNIYILPPERPNNSLSLFSLMRRWMGQIGMPIGPKPGSPP